MSAPPEKRRSLQGANPTDRLSRDERPLCAESRPAYEVKDPRDRPYSTVGDKAPLGGKASGFFKS